MTPQSYLELVSAEPQAGPALPPDMESDLNTLNSSAAQLAGNLAWMPGQRESRHFRDRCENLSTAFRPLFVSLESRTGQNGSEDLKRLRENLFLLRGELAETCATFSQHHKLPQVRTPDGTLIPRIAALAQAFL